MEFFLSVDSELVAGAVSGLVHLPDFLVEAPTVARIVVTLNIRILIALMKSGLPSVLISLHYIYLWAWLASILASTVEAIVASIIKVAVSINTWHACEVYSSQASTGRL